MPADGQGGFDVTPQHLHFTAYRVVEEQWEFLRAALNMVTDLERYRQAAGNGDGPAAFAEAYAKAARKFIEVWDKSVLSIGGSALGLSMTANNYAGADHASHPKAKGPPPKQAPPQAITKSPDLGNIPSIKWTGHGDGNDDPVTPLLGEVPDLIRPPIQKAVESVFQTGKLHEVTPGADEDELRNIAEEWRDIAKFAKETANTLAGLVASITDATNSEWQAAMRQFCDTLWGSTAWGKQRNGVHWNTDAKRASGGRTPVIRVLDVSARAIASACTDVANAHETARESYTGELRHAIKATAKDLAVPDPGQIWGALTKTPVGEAISTFREKMNTEAVNASIDEYEKVCHQAARAIEQQLPKLEEAFRSAPTFRAQEARAESFGARALHEFKREHNYTVPGERKKDHDYPIDLANQEGIDGGHTMDRHVGKTDDQLAQRLRDQQTSRDGVIYPKHVSTFKNPSSAQRFTQATIDKNESEIKKWLRDKPDQPTKELPENFGTTKTGATVSRSDYDQDGLGARSTATHSVNVVLKRAPDMDPPFIVLTSMPTRP